MREIRIAFISILRPIFRGASIGLWEESLKMLETLKDNLGFTIAYQAQPIAEEAEAIACVKAIQGENIDLILIHHVTFATSELLLPILELDLPTALWAMPEFTTEGPLPQNALFGWISQLRWAGRAQSTQTFLANILHHRLPHHLTWGRNDYEKAMLECCYWMGYQPLEASPQANNGLVSWPM